MGNQSCCSRDDYVRRSLETDAVPDYIKGQRASQDSGTRPTEDPLPSEAEKRNSISSNRHIFSESCDSQQTITGRSQTITSPSSKVSLLTDGPVAQSRWFYVNQESIESAKEFNNEIYDAFVNQYDHNQELNLTKRIRKSSQTFNNFDQEPIKDMKTQNTQNTQNPPTALTLELEREKYWPEQQFGRAKGVYEEKEDLSFVEYDYDLRRSTKNIRISRETFQAVLPTESANGGWVEQNSRDITPKFTEGLRISGRMHESKRVHSEETVEFSVVNHDLLDSVLKNVSQEKSYRPPEIGSRSRYEDLNTKGFKPRKAVGYHVLEQNRNAKV